ncbi:hypothetical protein IWW52_004697, partial [Coemansia sp. RSA 2704]
SAKAVKRPTKKQKELKKVTRAAPSVTAAAVAVAAPSKRATPATRTSGGGVSKSKSIRTKARASGMAGRTSKAKKADYLDLFGKK